MANRYWIAGSASWTTSNTANWSAAAPLTLTSASCSGTALTTTGSPALVVGMVVISATNTSLGTIVSGSGNSWVVSVGGTFAAQTMYAATNNASVPTTADDVFFNAASGTGSVTITLTGALNCLSLNTTGSGSLTFTGTGTLNCAGNFTIVSPNAWAATGTITFSSTTTGRTITTNARNLSCAVTFNGVGGGWTSAGTLTAGNLTLTAGTFSSGGFSIFCPSVLISGTTTRTLNITNSLIVLTAAWTATTTTGLTFTSTGSTISLSSNSNTFNGGGLTYNIVNFTSAAVALFTINGANTFTTLTITNRSAVGVSFYAIGANQTISGTFTLASNGGASSRAMLVSDITGTNRTITAAAVSLGDVDFRNITGAGAASPFTGTRLGNASGNSGITFTTPKNVYWNLAGTNNWNAVGWAATSGGTPAVANYPLPQDTAFIEGVGTAITLNAALNLPAIDLLTASSAVQLQFTNGCSIYGFLKLGTANPTGSLSLTFGNQDTDKTITSNGRSLSSPIVIDTIDTTVSLTDALITVNPLTVTSGTYSTANFSHSSQSIVSTGTITRAINLGSSAVSVTGIGTVLNLVATGLTMTAGTSTITVSDSSATTKTFISGVTLHDIVIGGSTSTSLIIFDTSSFTMNSLTSTRTVAYTLQFIAVSSFTIGTWGITGTAGNVVSLQSITAGTQATLSITNKTTGIDYLSISDINSTSIAPVTFWAGANSTNTSNNRGIAFASGATTSAYILTSGTSFTTPGDWNNASNFIYLIGGGGGGSGAVYTSTAPVTAVGGAGGGGGGYTLLTNQTLSGAISYAIGAVGAAGGGNTGTGVRTSTGGTGGTTTWNTTNTATGGTGGTVSTAGPVSTGGTGGTGTYTGGTGGVGGTTTAANSKAGGGGGGSAGVNGNGANGGTGNSTSTNADLSGGGGGGNGGGTAGGIGTVGASGTGGNNLLGTGGGASVNNANGATGNLGGGGSGGEGTAFRGGIGGYGADILGGFGSGGGSGGGTTASNSAATPGLYGGGGGGGGVSTLGSSGAAGAQGAIIIVYTIGGGGGGSLSNFFLLF